MSSLPPELQREIFECAVRLNHKNAAVKLNLSLVARHVHLWVDHAFYELVTIEGLTSAEKFLKLVDCKPPDFFAPVVKTLLVCGLRIISASQAARILSACAGVQALYWWTEDTLPPLVLSAIRQLPLRRLVVTFRNLGHIIPAPTPPTWLTSLTHLDSLSSNVNASDLDHLSQLPRLTHVALYLPSGDPQQVGPSRAKAVCANCPALRLLLVFGSKISSRPYAFDSRIVMSQMPTNTVRDWEAPYFGAHDMWTRGEKILSTRRFLNALQKNR
ncbi:hypothetical protein C8R45DRAFT_955003 [Mycena sanguinolenta]|nr:hypothetical protein C8R45DRAFT_955003 [Mycena sanguinolenta]